jgi:hypothetical protein
MAAQAFATTEADGYRSRRSRANKDAQSTASRSFNIDDDLSFTFTTRSMPVGHSPLK